MFGRGAVRTLNEHVTDQVIRRKYMQEYTFSQEQLEILDEYT